MQNFLCTVQLRLGVELGVPKKSLRCVKFVIPRYFRGRCIVFVYVQQVGRELPRQREPVFLNGYGAQESIPRNEFRQPI